MASSTQSPSQLLTEQVTSALRTVMDPDLNRDLVSLNMIRDLKVSEYGPVSFTVMLTTPACPMKDKIKADAEAAVKRVPGVSSVNIKMDAEVRAQRSAPQPGSIPGVTHVIAVSSGKGGVGKSTVSTNLAVSLALEGARVGILDLDIQGPNLPTMLGVTESPYLKQDEIRGELFVPPMSYGIKVLSMGMLVEGDQALIWRGPMLHQTVNQFLHKVEWGELDYLVVDMPPGTGDIQLSLSQMVPITGTVLVTTPQEVAAQDVRRAFSMWSKVRVPLLGVVENMSYFRAPDTGKSYSIFGSGGGEMLAKKFGTELLAQIPIGLEVREGGDEGRPIVVRAPEHESAQVLRKLAQRVAQKVALLDVQSNGAAAHSPTVGAF